MVESVGWLRVGREEVPDEDTRLVLDLLATYRDKAYAAWVARYPEERATWTHWHTLGAVGPFGRWHTIDLEVWTGFARDVVPVLQHRIRYDVRRDQADPVAAPLDPPVLHLSSRFITPATFARLYSVDVKAGESSFQKLLNAESLLRKESLLDPVNGSTRSAWQRLLAQQGLRIEGSLPGKIAVLRGEPGRSAVSPWIEDVGLGAEYAQARAVLRKAAGG